MDDELGGGSAPADPPKPSGQPVLNRRTVLAAAGSAGLGVAAARLVALASEPELTRVPMTGGLANRAGLDWVSPLGDESARVAHLLRRTTLGASAAELEQAQSDGYARTVDRLLETPVAEPAPFPGGDEASEEKPLNIVQLQQWWIDHMLATPTPFAERMTFFWHGHFTSDFRKVGPQAPYLYWQNLTWRRYALADLRTLLYQVTIDPAMLRYLDLAASTARNPNENYARELMELFTMGPEAFTEDDVKAASKALAGWREPLTQPMLDAQLARAMMRGQTPRKREADTVKVGVLERRRSYTGPAFAFLGETKVWNTEDLLDKILAQDATAPFVVRRLLASFATPTPNDDHVARLAAGFRKSKYDVKTLMHDILASPEFTAPASYRALVKSPVEFMVSTLKALGGRGAVPPQGERTPAQGASAQTRTLIRAGQGMGQVLFDPPNVGGWPENGSWISSNTMLARANLVTTVMGAVRVVPPAANAHQTHLDGVLSAQTLKLLNEATDDRRRWAIVLASPEFQLR